MTRDEMIALFKSAKQKVGRGAKKAGGVLNLSTAMERAAQRRQDKRLADQAEIPLEQLREERRMQMIDSEVSARLDPITGEIERTTRAGGRGASGVQSQAAAVPAEESAGLGTEGLTEEEIKALAHQYVGESESRKKEATKLRLQKALNR